MTHLLQDQLNVHTEVCATYQSILLTFLDIDSIDAFKEAIPWANIYAWNSESKSSDLLNGAVHAKCAVADGALAFITSANLTRAAMENNMEVGVLVRGGELPKQLEKNLESLVISKIINPAIKR